MKKMKRALSLMAAGVMALSTMGTTVHAETTIKGLEPTITDEGNLWYGNQLSVDIDAGKNGYTFRTVYIYEKKGDDYYYSHPELFRHATYEMSNHRIIMDDIKTETSLFALADASTDYKWTPNGPYSYGESNYEALYCCDIDTSIVNNAYYKRVNLEDSNYYDEEAAAHIRGILMNSYPYLSVEEMKQSLAEDGFKYADKLTRAEMISAVQAAIWTFANGIYDDSTASTFKYFNTFNVTENCQWGGALHDITNETRKAWSNPEVAFPEVWRGAAVDDDVAERINSLIEYLVAKKAVNAKENEIIISDIEIIESAPIRVEGKEDVFSVDVQVALNNSGSAAEDNIQLAVYVDDEPAESKEIILGTEEYTFNVEAEMGQTIKAVVSGTQYVPRGVYFYEPEGGRDASQCLVGVAEGETDVYAEASVTMQERILQFHKKTEIAGEQYALKGIEFEIYYVGGVEEYNKALVDKDENLIAKYENPTLDLVSGKAPIATVVTDEGGRASYNLTQNDQQDGIYLIAEKEHDAIAKTLKPFLVAVPMTDENGHPVYHMNLSLKNEVVRPTVDKDVTEINQKEDSQDVGDNVTWIIRGDIPKDMAKSSLYQLTDVVDYRLTYDGNVVVKVQKISENANNDTAVDGIENSNVLVEGKDYTLSATPGHIDPNPNDAVDEGEAITTIVVNLTKAGREKAAQLAGEKYEDYEVRVYFDSHIDEDATVGINIPNTVTLEYINSANHKWTIEPTNKPFVYTCGINLYKHDAKIKDFALEGAKFKLAKAVAKGTEGAVQLVTKEDGKVDTVNVVYVDFWNGVELDPEKKINEVETDANGKAMLYGLEDGTYYLVETKAPVLVDQSTGEVTAKYNLLSYPVKVTLGSNSHLEDNRIEVANSNQFKLPSTGGIGTGIFTVSGSAMIALAGAVLVRNKKKETEE